MGLKLNKKLQIWHGFILILSQSFQTIHCDGKVGHQKISIAVAIMKAQWRCCIFCTGQELSFPLSIPQSTSVAWYTAGTKGKFSFIGLCIRLAPVQRLSSVLFKRAKTQSLFEGHSSLVITAMMFAGKLLISENIHTVPFKPDSETHSLTKLGTGDFFNNEFSRKCPAFLNSWEQSCHVSYLCKLSFQQQFSEIV